MKMEKLLILMVSQFYTKPQLKLELLKHMVSKVQYLCMKHYLNKLEVFQLFFREYCCSQH